MLQYLAKQYMQGRVAFLPFRLVALKSLKLKEAALPPQTIGQHIKKRRLELKLTRKEPPHGSA